MTMFNGKARESSMVIFNSDVTVITRWYGSILGPPFLEQLSSGHALVQDMRMRRAAENAQAWGWCTGKATINQPCHMSG